MIPSLLTDTITTDLDRALHYALLWGLEGVELRSVGRPGDRVPFVNESKLRNRLNETEMPPVAVVPGLFEVDVADRPAWLNELTVLDETLQFCRRIGCPRVVVSCFTHAGGDSEQAYEAAADALRQAGNLGAKVGVRICLLNERTSLAPTGALLARLASRADNVSAAWNPVEAVVSGEDAREGLAALEGRVELVRCRNVEGNGWGPSPIDRGRIDWVEQIDRLEDMGFEGPVSLEVTGEPRAKRGFADATSLIDIIRSGKRRG